MIVLVAVGMVMWDFSPICGSSSQRDEFVVKDILTGNLTIRPVAN